MTRLAEWDQFELRLNGEKIAGLLGKEIQRSGAPIVGLDLEFLPGVLRVDGKAKKGVTIPFQVEIRTIEADGTTVLVHLHRASAFGLPVPSLLISLFKHRIQRDELSWDESRRAFVIRLERFLPPFLDVDIEEIRPIAGGVYVRLGAGAADVPNAEGEA